MNTKRFYLNLYLLTFFLIFASFVNAQKKFVIVIDPGHGGSDHGANRNYADIGRVVEKDINLAVGLRVGKMLEKNKNFKIIYTRTTDEFPSLLARTDLANRSKADLFVSIHCNANDRTAPYGTETFVQGPAQNNENLEVAKRENDVIFLDDKDKEIFGSYNSKSPESLIALKLQQSKYLEGSLMLGSLVEENFVNKDKRFSRGVKQQNLHVLRRNAMPSILIETGFLSNHEEAAYMASEKGQKEISESIYDAIISYKKLVDKKAGVRAEVKAPDPVKPVEAPLKNDFRILLLSTTVRYSDSDPALMGLTDVLKLKENGIYKYYYGKTNLASERDKNIKDAKTAGFKNAYSVGFMQNLTLRDGYYTIEVYAGKDKLSANSPILLTLKDVDRNKINGTFYYTYGKVSSLEQAIKLQSELDAKNIKNTVIQKVTK